MTNIYFSYLANLLNTRKGSVIVSLFLFIIVLMTTYPIYLERLGSSSDDSFFFHKIDAPLKPMTISQDTHGSKAAFRLTAPLIAKVLGLGTKKDSRRIVVLYLIQSILLLPFFYILIIILKRHLNNFQTILFVAACSSVYITKAFFWDVDFWFDGLAYFFLLLGMYFRNRWSIFCSLTLACWTDERAVVALSSIYFFHLLQENDYNLQRLGQIFGKDFFTNRSVMPILAGCCYLMLRGFLAVKYSLHTPYGDGTGLNISLIPQQFSNGLAGIFLTFEGLWLFFLMVILYTFAQKKFLTLGIFLCIISVHIAVAYSVLDITRSLTYAFPIFIIAVIFVGKNMTQSTTHVFSLATLLCFLIPTQFLIGCPLQIPWLIFSFSKLSPIMHLVLNFLHI